MNVQKAIDGGLSFLAGQQQSNGSFIAACGPRLPVFVPHRTHSSIFFTSLIAGCLSSSESELAPRAAAFLRTQASPDWTFNYWARHSPEATTYPYPDDLDDTACALIAVQNMQAAHIDGLVLGKLGQTLVANERAVGGPYYTWLNLKPKSNPIDFAVNANIAYLLKLIGVEAAGLTAFIFSSLESQQLGSAYYTDIASSYYFASRFIQLKTDTPHKLKNDLQIEVLKRLQASVQDSDRLNVALLVSAALRLGSTPDQVRSAVRAIMASQSAQAWPASILYKDPVMDGVQQYAGSESLTTAFCVEALQLYQTAQLTKPARTTRGSTNVVKTRQPKPPHAMHPSHIYARPTHLITSPYNQYRDSFLQEAAKPQITHIANITAEVLGRPVNKATLHLLNEATINGWLAYTIYDDFLDDEGDVKQLSIAHYATRQMLHQFQTAVSDTEYQTLVQTTLARVDAANIWESTHARGTIENNSLHVITPPDYTDFSQLADKSLGHMLASCGVVYLTRKGTDRQLTITNLRRFYHHFLIARQLNDDAHDWEEDIRNGHISAVVALLLQDYCSDTFIVNFNDMPELRRIFWEQTIVEVSRLIALHSRLALRSLTACHFPNPEAFIRWITSLQSAADQALTQRGESQKFMRAYTKASSIHAA